MRRRSTKTRRDFLKDAARVAGAASLASFAGCFPDVGGRWPHVTEACLGGGGEVPQSLAGKVSEVVCEASVVTKPRYELQVAQVRPMLEAALGALAPSIPELWKQVFPDYSDATRIGIKVNCLNSSCATSVALVGALADVLVETLGVSRDRILVWDRRTDELTQCGFTREALGGVQVEGTVRSPDDQGGPGYGEPICGAVAGKTPRLSRILTELTDVTINVPVLKTHVVSGVTAAFKNIYGIIDNPGDYHANLVQTLPVLYALPPIRNSMRLHVLDAFRAVVTGGTSDPADTVPKMIAVSADPLALDSYSLARVNEFRTRWSLDAVGSDVTGWLQGARDLGLGTLEYQRIQRTL
ncbi:MAG TPA: DUF362 domain-containing protein [Myxococcales bacterium]|jgi:hypothetical protein